MAELSKERRQARFHRLVDSKENPCVDEHMMSMKCVHENPETRHKCETYFQNYRLCKQFWNKVTHIRKIEGRTPAMPPPEDRAKVLEEYRYVLDKLNQQAQ